MTDSVESPPERSEGDSAAHRQESAPEPRQPESANREVSVRTAPKYVPFLVTGALLGVIAALVVAVVPENPQYDKSTLFGYFVVLFIILGLGLGGLSGLAVDWAGRRRARRVVLEAVPEREDPEPGPDQSQGRA